MKKITLLAALLGTTYFANAQVGIGTPDPATSAELDIVAKAGDKGILIPRVTLTEENKFAPITGAQIESLLVYNNTASATMPKGFYYWDGAKWNRIVGKEELDTVINNLGDNITNITTKLEGDVKNLQAVVNYILPSNPDNNDPTKPVHTTIVYDHTTGDMHEVVYDATTKKYITKKIDLQKMIQGKETNTFFKDIKDANNKITGYVYFNEKTIVEAIGTETDPNKIKDILDKLDGNTKGAIKIEVKETVVNNIQEILESPVNIVIKTVEGDKTFTTTVEEYLQYITQFSDGNVIYKNLGDDKNPNWVFQYYDKTSGSYVTIKLEDLVAGFETMTNILRSETLTNGTLEDYKVVAAPVKTAVKKGEIFYKYNNEDKGEQFINMTADIISSINNNEDVKNALTNVLNQGGNVYFGDVKGKEVFYTMVVNADGTTTKTPIELPASFILDIINKYKDVVKNALGDHIDNKTTIVNTGNTYNGKMVFLAKGKTTVGKEEGGEKYPSPLTTGVTLDLSQIEDLTSIEDVLTVSILKGGKVVASTVADLVAAGNKLEFAIGTGAFYTALPYGEYEVVVEFTGNITVPMTPITQP